MEKKLQSSESERSTYDVYDIVSKYDFLLVPAANAIAGAVGFGLPGAIVGVAVGTIDEVLVNFSWTNGRYLSPVLQGVSSFATLTTSWTIRCAGGALSFVFSQLATSDYSEYADKITSPLQVALQIGYVFGWKGAIGGVVLSGMEEVFIHYKFYNKHYISTAASFISVTHLLKEKTGTLVSHYVNDKSKLNLILAPLKILEQKVPYFLESIAAVASSIKSVYETSEEYNVIVLGIQKDIREIYIKLGMEAEYFDILEKQVLTTLGFRVAEQFLFFKLIGCVQKQDKGFYGELTNNDVWGTFKAASKDILKVLPGVVAIQQIFSAPIESYFSLKSQNLLYEAVSQKWLVGEIPLKILQQADAEVLIDNLNRDIAAIANSGEGLRKSFFNGITESTYSQYLMYQYNYLYYHMSKL